MHHPDPMRLALEALRDRGIHTDLTPTVRRGDEAKVLSSLLRQADEIVRRIAREALTAAPPAGPALNPGDMIWHLSRLGTFPAWIVEVIFTADGVFIADQMGRRAAASEVYRTSEDALAAMVRGRELGIVPEVAGA